MPSTSNGHRTKVVVDHDENPRVKGFKERLLLLRIQQIQRYQGMKACGDFRGEDSHTKLYVCTVQHI